MSKRIKVTPIPDADTFYQTVNAAADIQTEINVLEARRDRALQRVAAAFAAKLAPLDEAIKAKVTLAEAYADAHKKELLPKDKKSVELAQAIFGWRTGMPAVRFTSKQIEEATVVEALKANHLGTYVRTVEEVAKDKILADAKRIEERNITVLNSDRGTYVILAEVGLKITQSETFYIEPKVATGETLKPAEAAA